MHDTDADRITAVLEALGYRVSRQLDEKLSMVVRLNNATEQLARRHKLTDRECDVAKLVLADKTFAEIGESLGISKATVKWHMHNVFAKTKAGTRGRLLRLALQIIGD